MKKSYTTPARIALVLGTYLAVIVIVTVSDARHAALLAGAGSATLATTTPAQVVPNPFTDVALTAASAIVVDLSTGEVLYQKNPDAQLPLASLTKLITLAAAVRTLAPDSRISISSSSLAQDGTNGFTSGEIFRFDDLAKFTLVVSSNDGAEAIAEAAAASGDMTTLELLSSALTTHGLTHTYALNGTGLDENAKTAGAYGTVRDIATLAAALVTEAPWLTEATTHQTITVRDAAGKSFTDKNTNQDVIHMPGLLLSKTGYTDLAGGNLVVVWDAGIGHRVAIVAMGSTLNDRFTDIETLTRATLAYFSTDRS